MNKLQELTKLGQSIWLDYIRRSFIASGELKSLIDEGVRGVTSNPTIFEKAIAGSSDYDDQLGKLAGSGWVAGRDGILRYRRGSRGFDVCEGASGRPRE